MNKKKVCMFLTGFLLFLSIISSFVNENLSLVIGILMLILSFIILINAFSYSKEYKDIYDKKPNGIGLITFGAIFNIVCGIIFGAFNSMGTLFILIGNIIMLFTSKND